MIDSMNCIPQMDEEGLAYFRNKLKLSHCYLEYGCGGSTVYACSLPNIKVVLSVDSDPVWIAKVKGSAKGSSSHTPPTLLLAHCDIGEVGDWGVPINKNKSDHFWKYMAAPWDIARSRNYVPDTILIDGRFRVACFLYSLLAARVGATILFDDWAPRTMPVSTHDWLSVQMMAVFERDFPPSWLPFVHLTPLS
jgi:hypothetical protein